MKKWFILASLLALSSQLIAKDRIIYKYTDETGNIVFSDTFHPGAEEIVIKDIPTYKQEKDSSTNLSAEPTFAETEAEGYLEFMISSPANNEVIRNNEGNIGVQIKIKPALISGHKIRLELDGSATGEAQSSPLFALKNVDRGLHTIRAKVIDNQGNIVQQSDSVSFQLHRFSALLRRN